MATSYQMQNYFRPAPPLNLDTTRAHVQHDYIDEEAGILDDGILDHGALDSGLDMSPQMGEDRRESFAVSATLFSPKTEDWQSVDMQSVPSNNPYLDAQTGNTFSRLDEAPTYPQWSLGQQQFDGLNADYATSNAAVYQRPMPMQTPFTSTGNQVPVFTAGHHVATSPRREWTGGEVRSHLGKRMRTGSPMIAPHGVLSREGIRKKNARFEIPAERNLNNIDLLIAQSTDELEIKELKQQKRLLRNRQAALDSRQRKKQHTERLEDEKKHYTVVINSMEEEITELRATIDSLCSQVEGLQMDKEDMLRGHTMETGDLRKKVGVLADHVQRLESAPVVANTGYAGAETTDYGLNVDGSWEHLDFIEYMEPEAKPETQLVAKRAEPTSTEVEKPATQGGLLFMLFLVGAFVLSNGSASSGFPNVPDDMRQASASLLESIFQDAGIPQTGMSLPVAAAPQPSGAARWSAPSDTVNGGGVAPSMLGRMTDSLTQPSQEQANEQIFSLSAAQYNGVGAQDFQGAPPRRNLADALASLRGDEGDDQQHHDVGSDKESVADVYTRSLLWDQIPGDVVRSFAKMVADASRVPTSSS